MIFNGFKINKNFKNIKFLLVLMEKARKVFSEKATIRELEKLKQPRSNKGFISGFCLFLMLRFTTFVAKITKNYV